MRPDAGPDAWRRYDAPGGDADYPAYDPASERRRVRRRIGVLVIGALVVLGGTGAGIAALVVNALDGDSGTSASTTTTTITTDRTEITTSGGGADLYTTRGTATMVEALVKETGSTAVHQVVVYPGNAVLMVPTGSGSRTFLWDGEQLVDAGPTISPRRPFDLARLDGAVLGRLCGSRPSSCVVVAGRPQPGDHGAWLTVAGLDGVHLTDLAGKAV